MLTPRRTLLLLAGFVLFCTAYAAYAQFLGWLDGLPQLPDSMLKTGIDGFRPPDRTVSPTQLKLREAFGPNAIETDYIHYPNQFSFINGDSLIVLASGQVPSKPESTRVLLSPFSVAIFGKPKPVHLRQPGEVMEITTIHSDKAVLEFDRIIHNPNDMQTAKLVRMELVSDLELGGRDERRGQVEIINNQRSADPDNALVIHTPGPVFYRDVKAVAGTPAANDPDFWTDAPVEIVDRQNLPRAIGAAPPRTVVAKGEDLRSSKAVADIIAGRRAAPPTISAIGLRVYLEPNPPPGQPNPKKGSGGLNGVRRLELLEKVLLHLWIENGQSLPGSPQPNTPTPPTSPEPAPTRPLSFTPPPGGIAALTGCIGPAAYTARLLHRALLQVETRGPFAYDAERATARFDVVPNSDPNLPNDVQVTKISAYEGNSSLFSQVLELELNGGPTNASRPANSPAINKLHAWTYTPGRWLTIASETEAMQAYGQDLVHDQTTKRTVLRGAPLYVFRDRNVLSAGSPQRPATLITEPGPGPDHKQQMTVKGAGKIELFDAATNAHTTTAYWRTTLVHTKETIDGREQDLLVFTDDAKFEDVKADYWLKGKVLKLWLESRAPQPDGKAAPADSTAQPRPSHLQAVGDVLSHSADYDIKQCEQLNVFFADAKPAAPAVVAAAPPPAEKAVATPTPAPAGPPPSPTATPVPSPAATPTAVAGGPKPPEPLKEPEKPKPPMEIRAKDIQTWVRRVPQPVPTAARDPKLAAGKQAAPASESVKYELERARCEDNVIIHQDPTDPTKPRGVDIVARLLLIEGSPDGNIMTVYGWPNRFGEVHQEDMSLIGPEIVLDQLHNAASVDGRGALKMPSNSDLSGNELKQAEVIVVQWRDRMVFKGAMRSAEFTGKVSALQGGSRLECHNLQVVFDRPIYFNQMQKKSPPPPKKIDPKAPKAAQNDDKAKVDKVFCYPAPADAAEDKSDLIVKFNQVELDPTGKMIKSQHLTAQELKIESQVQDPEGGERYQRVEALGPGIVRIWQPGDKEMEGAAPTDATQPAKPMPMGMKPTPAKKDEQEMKLTQIIFGDRMVAIDKGKVFQQATFKDGIQVINIPANSPTVEIVKHRLPHGAMLLTCNKELVVWTHKQGNDPPLQRMTATGNAYLRTDEYDGWADLINSDGPRVILTGSDAIPARVMNRFNQGNDQSGKKIIYDRAKGSFKVIGSFGGSFGAPPNN